MLFINNVRLEKRFLYEEIYICSNKDSVISHIHGAQKQCMSIEVHKSKSAQCLLKKT